MPVTNAVRPRAKRAINTAPNMFRLVTRGAVDRTKKTSVIDRDVEPAGAIKRLSVITLGEANGWWLDEEFIDAVARLGAKTNRIKSRFTHPGMSSDGLGTQLGRMENFVREGDQVYADLKFIEAATESPNGNLPAYVMKLAEEVPEDFGVSIVFRRDFGEEDRFRATHTDEKGEFKSPDERNEDNLPHIRLRMLRAVDAVDTPAANPDGLFDGQTSAIAESADGLLEYALGLTDEEPTSNVFGVHHERIRTYFQGFLSRRQLALTDAAATVAASTTKEEEMELSELTLQQLREERSDLVDQLRSELVAEAGADAEKGAAGTAEQLSQATQAAREEGMQAERDRLKTLKEAFPEREAFAIEQFEAGASIDEAKDAFRDVQIKELQKENSELKKRAGAQPVEFSGEQEGGEKTHLERARAYKEEHKCSMSKALSATAEKH